MKAIWTSCLDRIRPRYTPQDRAFKPGGDMAGYTYGKSAIALLMTVMALLLATMVACGGRSSNGAAHAEQCRVQQREFEWQLCFQPAWNRPQWRTLSPQLAS